jgi:hypothetical protein
VSELIQVAYPFARCKVDIHDGEGGTIQIDSWKPGTRSVFVYPDDSEDVADGMGWMNLAEVSRHKPGKYPERVFYVRTFTDPDGRTFGKTHLRMTTAQNFKRLSARFNYRFRMAGEEESNDDYITKADATF